MNIWLVLLFCVPLHAMEMEKKEIKTMHLETRQNINVPVMMNNQEKEYNSQFSNDLTEWQILKEKVLIRKIESKYPIVVSAIKHNWYSYSNNKMVVFGDLNTKDTTMLEISNVDFLSWNPQEKRLLIRSLLDGIGYFVYDVTEKKQWYLTVQKSLWERVVGYIICTLGLPGINYISDMHWIDRDTLIDMQRKATWSLK